MEACRTQTVPAFADTGPFREVEYEDLDRYEEISWRISRKRANPLGIK